MAEETVIPQDTPNFNEVQITGSSWERTGRVVIDNPLQGVPSIMTVDEYVEPARGGGLRCTPFGNMHLQFDQSNPKHVQLYTLLNEIVLEMREVRDAKL